MSESDAFFTQSIVGAPFSIVLGRRVVTQTAHGIEVPLDGAPARLSRAWREQVLLQTPGFLAGPRRQGGRVRRWLERHALVIAGLGLVALAAALLLTVFLAVMSG